MKAKQLILLASVLALSASPVFAQCPQWDVSGKWGMQQSNGYTTMVTLSQSGKRITGTASYRGKTKGPVSGIIEKVNPVTGKVVGDLEPKSTVTHQGAISGSIEGDTFYAEISWEGGGGIYNGKVGPDGRIQGTTYDRNKPSSRANWSSTAPMNCAPAAVSAATPKVIKSTGKAPTSAPPPAPTATPRVIKATGKAPTKDTASAGVPKIILFNKPGQAPGTRTLTWDGGPDHPYAEVWVKVDGADETFVVEQGKGMRQVTVEPGKTYQYILTDSGKQLATTTAK